MTDQSQFIPTRGMRAGAYRPDPLFKIFGSMQNVQTLRSMPKIITSQEVTVPDIAFWDDDDATVRKVDFEQMQKAGARGVIIRGGQGAWIDEDFVDYWRAAKAAGLPRGSYWFYDPRNSAKDQADLFASLFVSDPPELGLTLDAEYPTSWGGAYAGWNHLYDFLERLKVKLPNPQKEIYTGYYWWYENVWIKATAAQLQYFKQYPLHLAWYISDPAYVKIPQPWDQTSIRWWQYTDKGNGPLYGGEALNIDLNYFVPGGVTEFRRTFSLSTAPPPPTPVDIVTHPYAGVEHHKFVKNGVDVHVTLIDMQGKRAQVVFAPDLKSITQFAKETGAQIVVNGHAWNDNLTPPITPNDLESIAASDGKVIVNKKIGAPFLNITKDNVISMPWNDYSSLWNTIAGFRYLTYDGEKQKYLDDLTKVDNVELHVRSAKGYAKDGRLILVKSEGVHLKAGLTLSILGDVFDQFDAIRSMDSDSGSSAGMYIESEGGLIGNGGDKPVATALLIFTGDTNTMSDYNEIIGNDGNNHTVRDNHSILGAPVNYPNTTTRANITNITKAESGITDADVYIYTADVPNANLPGGFEARKGDKWRKVYKVGDVLVSGWTAEIHLGVKQGITIKLITVVTPPPTTPTPDGFVFTLTENGTTRKFEGTINKITTL